jgi:hypothetical protein
MPLVLPFVLTVLGLGVLSGCDKGNGPSERRYCDQSGCYACLSDNNCYPVPGDPSMPAPNPNNPSSCDTDAQCGTGMLCNLGKCNPGCAADASCPAGDICAAGHCRPAGSPQCGIAGAICTADTQCGTDRACIARECANSCATSSCAHGQVCAASFCIEDPAPLAAECLYDGDCGGGQGGFRCINAYCLPTCKAAADCSNGASCVTGICRGNRLAG